MTLVWLILIPFIGGMLSWQSERWGEQLPRWIALGSMLLMLALTLNLWWTRDLTLPALTGAGAHWAMEWHKPWIPRLGIHLHLALDGLSLVLIALTGFLGVLAVLCSWKEISRRVGFFHLNLLWILGGVVGVFLAIDLFLFFLFWEMMLVPMFFLIALWGHSGSQGRTRIRAATKFFIYTQASGLMMLVAILALVFTHQAQTGEWSFAYGDLLTVELSSFAETVLMLGFFIAFAVKLPIVPLHGWLPDAHAQAPTAGSVDLAGILLKTAAYGMLRFAIPFFPDASADFAPIAMALGVVGVFYGAILACGQQDVKRLIAYTSIAHMGFALIGIYAGTPLALQGVVVLMVAHAFSAAALFILSGQLYERIHTRDMRQMGGLWGRVGSLPAFTLCFVAASLGLPGTANFVGEFMVLFGAFPVAPVIVIVSGGGLVLAAVYSLLLLQRVHFGPPQSQASFPGLDRREFWMMLATLALVFYFGLYPQPLLDATDSLMTGVSQVLTAAGSDGTLATLDRGGA